MEPRLNLEGPGGQYMAPRVHGTREQIAGKWPRDSQSKHIGARSPELTTPRFLLQPGSMRDAISFPAAVTGPGNPDETRVL